MPPTLAVTVLVYVPATVPEVNRPVVALMLPPPAATDQLGVIVITLPAGSLPTAANCWLVPVASVTGVGVTVMVASGTASPGLCSHAATASAVKGTIQRRRAASRRRADMVPTFAEGR